MRRMVKVMAVVMALVTLMCYAPLSLAEKTLEPVTLEYWILGPGKQKDSDMVWEKFNEVIQEYLPNTTVHFTSVADSEYADRWSRAMAAGEQVDLAWTGWFHDLPTEASRGSLLPLDDLLAKYGQDILAFYGEDVLNLHRLQDGSIYQIPAWQGLVGGRYAYRFPKQLADIAGENWVNEFQQVMYENCDSVSVEAKSKVYDKMEEYLAALYNAGKIAKGYNMANGLFTYYLNLGRVLVGRYGYVEIGDDTFTVKPLLTSDLYKMDAQYMADWFKKGYIRSDIASVESIINDWRTDGIEGYVNGGSDGLIDIAKHATAESGFEFVAAYTNPNPMFTLGTATGTSIPFTSKNPDRAMMLMNFLVSEQGKEAYRLFVYGIEGVHWNWSEAKDGTIVTTGGLGQATGDWAYGGWKWTLGTCTNSLYTSTDIVGEFESKKELEKTAYVNPLVSFSFNNEAVQNEQINITALETEYKSILTRGYLGDGWEAAWNEYASKLDAAGMGLYIEELQRQVTEFVAANNCKW